MSKYQNSGTYPIYKKSGQLRPLVNSLKNSLLSLQEIALNSAINASREKRSSHDSVYEIVANLIRKNCEGMIAVLLDLNEKFDELISLALAGINIDKKFERLALSANILSGLESRAGLSVYLQHNQEALIEAMNNNRLEMAPIYLALENAVNQSHTLFEQLREYNKKIWLTAIGLKIENNVAPNKVEFFVNVIDILDQQNEFMTEIIQNIFYEVLVIDHMITQHH